MVRRGSSVLVVCAAVAILLGAASAASAVDLVPGARVTSSPFRSFGNLNGDSLKDLGSIEPSGSTYAAAYSLQSPAGVFGPPVNVLDLPDPDLSRLPSPVLADMTGDSRDEQVFALVREQNQIAFVQPIDAVLVPPGARRWSFASLAGHVDSTRRVLSGLIGGDVTGDGRTDAVIATIDEPSDTGGPEVQRVVIAWNNGAGSPATRVSTALPPSTALLGPKLADVDRNGALDILVATDSGIGYLGAPGGALTAWNGLPGLGI